MLLFLQPSVQCLFKVQAWERKKGWANTHTLWCSEQLARKDAELESDGHQEMQICSRWTPRTKTKPDLRQLENPKTWPILHQGIAGPIQSGRRPPPSSFLHLLPAPHALWIHSPPPGFLVCWAACSLSCLSYSAAPPCLTSPPSPFASLRLQQEERSPWHRERERERDAWVFSSSIHNQPAPISPLVLGFQLKVSEEGVRQGVRVINNKKNHQQAQNVCSK